MTGDALFLGVDGGGSQTRAVLVDVHGHERGRGMAGSANHRAVGMPRALRQIQIAIAEALNQSGSDQPITAAWLGLAGIDHPTDQEHFLPDLASLASAVTLTNDADLLLGALPESVGVALIAGTGAIACGRDVEGKTTRSNGWGHIIGDEGSGYDIGRRALQSVALATDGRGPTTALSGRIMAHLDLNDPLALIAYVHREGKAAIAALSSLVFSVAEEGDRVAQAITRRAATELARSALAVAKRLEFRDALPLALGGGLLIHETGYRERALSVIKRSYEIASLAVVDDPALSAARGVITLTRH